MENFKLWAFLAQMDVPIQVWHIIEIMRRDFSEHRQIHVPITENQVGTVGMIFYIAQQIEMNYPDMWPKL